VAGFYFFEVAPRVGTALAGRAELYDFLGYHAYEDKLDALFAQNK
jgi:methylisocitrate lyase